MLRMPSEAARSAAATISSASATVLANGFSQRTCLPASNAATAISAWLSPGVQMSTRATSSRWSSCFQSVSVDSHPSWAAAAPTLSALRPHSAVISGRNGRSKVRPAVRQATEWAAPMKA